jgi:ApbE superfamily uncharacterized protein (UPF0280 family)
MSMGAHPPVSARLGDGRWHFQHGPIDLIVDLRGAPAACERAIAACWKRFCAILSELVGELGELRQPASEHPRINGDVATRMMRACAPFAAERFITPMAAVAGAVADELIGYCCSPGITRASINNGGDIALHLTPGEVARVGICADPRRIGGRSDPILDGRFTVEASMPVRGIATSGCRGRSLSLGIADSVTVLASTAAAADAAATLIANAVNSDHPGIVRAPATQVKDDSDLGTRLVTVHVPALPSKLRAAALRSGRNEAEYWQARGLIYGAALLLQGEAVVVPPPMPASRVPSALELPAGHLFA